MLTKSVICHGQNDAVTRQIMDAIAELIQESKLTVVFEEYRESVVLDKQRLATGKNTFILKFDGGAPEVDIMVDSGNCCGQDDGSLPITDDWLKTLLPINCAAFTVSYETYPTNICLKEGDCQASRTIVSLPSIRTRREARAFLSLLKVRS